MAFSCDHHISCVTALDHVVPLALVLTGFPSWSFRWRIPATRVHSGISPLPSSSSASSSSPNTVPMVAARAARLTARQVWLGEKGAYPVIAVSLFASALATAQGVRYLVGHPDVSFNKDQRANMFKYDAEHGAKWQSHRRPIAKLHANPVNTSKFNDM